MKKKKPVEIFCDGSYDTKNKVGGYATIMLFGDKIKKYSSRSYSETSIARMEMKGIIFGLETVKPGFDIFIYSDHKMIVDSINKWLDGWIKDDRMIKRANVDLWRRFVKIRDKHIEGGSDMLFSWIRSHTGHKYNEMADHYAVKARRKKNPLICKREN